MLFRSLGELKAKVMVLHRTIQHENVTVGQMNRASELLVVHLSARLLSFMPTFLLLYSCNLFWCDTKFILNVQPPAEENSKPFLYSVGCSLYLHWWRSLMPSGCNLCNRLNSLALVSALFISSLLFPRFASGRNYHGPYTGRRIHGSPTGRR